MIPTYVFGWPTGQETGSYLAVDLGELLPPFAFSYSSSFDAALLLS